MKKKNFFTRIDADNVIIVASTDKNKTFVIKKDYKNINDVIYIGKYLNFHVYEDIIALINLKGQVYIYEIDKNLNIKKKKKIQCDENIKFKKVRYGNRFVLALSEDNYLYAFGEIVNSKKLIKFYNEKIIDFSSGYDHIIAIREDGVAVGYGSNIFYQNCVGYATNEFKEIKYKDLYKNVFLERFCSFLINKDNKITFYGSHDTFDVNALNYINKEIKSNIKKISIKNYLMFLDEYGNVYKHYKDVLNYWRKNNYFKLLQENCIDATACDDGIITIKDGVIYYYKTNNGCIKIEF